MCGSHNLDKNIFCFYYYYLCWFSGIKGTPFQAILNTHFFPSFRDFKAILLPLFLLFFFPLAQSPSPLLSLNSHHLQPEHHHFSSSCRPTSPSHSLDFSSNQQRRVPCSSVDLSINIQSLRFRSSSAVIVPLRSSSSSPMLFLNDDQQQNLILFGSVDRHLLSLLVEQRSSQLCLVVVCGGSVAVFFWSSPQALLCSVKPPVKLHPLVQPFSSASSTIEVG